MSKMHHFTSGRRDNKLLTEKVVLQEEQAIEQVAKVEIKNVAHETETKLRLFLLNEKVEEKKSTNHTE